MNKEQMLLKQVSLTGFQAFRDRVDIPITPITLLYGPNSAGKSAIFDALNIAYKFWLVMPKEFPREFWEFAIGRKREQKLSSVWRKEASGLSRVVSIGTSISCPVKRIIPIDLWSLDLIENTTDDLLSESDTERNGSHGADRSDQVMVDMDLSFIGAPQDCSLSIDIVVDGVALYKFREGKEVAINILHPRHLKYGLSPLENLYGPLTFNDGWIKLSADVTLDGHKELVIRGGKPARVSDRDATELSSDYGISDFKALHYHQLRSICRVFQKVLYFAQVDASRTVPRDGEVEFHLDSHWQVVESDRRVATSQPKLEFQLLARAAGLEAMATYEAAELNGEEKRQAQRIQKINELLSTHLFSEYGYKVVADVQKLVPVGPCGNNAASRPHLLVKLALEDQSGIRLSFSDVGSGIGYVLPVFIALSGQHSCAIQQPELHLHPALQASIADAFVEPIRENGRSLIVETHSEHFLLRLLKRVPQTTDGRAGDFALSCDDISVIYVNPLGDGSSRIVSLPITATGDFAGRWPRGFFAERSRELFDE